MPMLIDGARDDFDSSQYFVEVKREMPMAERANKTWQILATPAVSAINGLTKLSNLSTCKLGLHERFLSLFFFFVGKTITKLQ